MHEPLQEFSYFYKHGNASAQMITVSCSEGQVGTLCRFEWRHLPGQVKSACNAKQPKYSIRALYLRT